MTSREIDKPHKPNMGKVADGLFQMFGGMAGVVAELDPNAVELNRFRPHLMAQAVEQVFMGQPVDGLHNHLQDVRTLIAALNRLFPFATTPVLAEVDKEIKS